MKTILIRQAEYTITLNAKMQILKNSSLFIEGNRILEVNSKRSKADSIIDASGMIVFPGFINTHLHTPQVFHRHCPAQQNKPIAQWIHVTTSINRELDEEAAYYGALVCFAELMLSGTTTSLDYFYPFVKGKKGLIEATIRAAKNIGIRFTSIRGSMSQSKKDGTLYDEDVVEDTDAILTHSKKTIETYHDASQYSMIRIGVGPCLPFASGETDYRETALLARKYAGVIMQTHAAESKWEVTYCQKRFGMTPIELMRRTEFLGKDVSLVHCNIISESEIKLLGKTRTNIILTPICNTRDASDGNGIAPLGKLVESGASISIGVDGPASNDSLNMLDEMRYLRVVSKAKEGLYWYRNRDQAAFSYMHPLDALAITNLGGAKTLNRDDIGSLEVGKAADIAIFDPKSELSHAGAVNQWASLFSCHAIKPKYLLVNGKLVVQDERLKTVDEQTLNKAFRKIHASVIARAQKRLRINLSDYDS